jgi:uroporphyrinogen-III synthase
VNIVVTREAGKNVQLMQWLPPDATVDEVPLTRTEYFEPEDVRVELATSAATGAFATLVVTSERSVGYVDLAREAFAPDVEVYSVGPRTTRALASRGVHVTAEGDGTADMLARHISKGPVLLLGAKAMRTELPTALRANGLVVTSIACYETIGVRLAPGDEQRIRDADVLLIGAPSAWAVARAFVASETWVVVPGESTAANVRSDHPRVLEGWGAQLRTRLAELASAPEG